MDLSISPKDEIWFLHVCRHISDAICLAVGDASKVSWLQEMMGLVPEP
jgi:hypothetical protein